MWNMEHSLKKMKERFHAQGIFHTDEKLAQVLKSFVPENVDEVYDPTCGRGALLSVFDDSVKKYGQELELDFIEDCKSMLVNFTGVCGDTLKDPAFLGNKFKAIVANPPFSTKWRPKIDERFEACGIVPSQSRSDLAFVLHCLYYLTDDGVAAILQFPGVLYRSGKEQEIRKWLVENNYIDKVVHIPKGHFEDTNIATCIIVLKKTRKTTDVVFEDKELGLSYQAAFEKIKENNFNLSTSTYIEKPDIREKINPIELEKQSRENVINIIRKQLNFSRAICELDSRLPPFCEFIDKLQSMINEFREKGGKS